MEESEVVKGFGAVSVIFAIAALALLIGGGWYAREKGYLNLPGPGGQQACTQEAKLCPDGSGVGRTGPNCEFAECPGATLTLFSGCEEKAGNYYQNTVPAKVEKWKDSYVFTMDCKNQTRSIDVQDPDELDQYLNFMIVAKYQYVEFLNNKIRCIQAPCGPLKETRIKIISIQKGETTNWKTYGTLAGKVSIGPNCPVERVDMPCPASSEAYASREFLVLSSDQKQTIASFHANANGNYSVSLPASNYVVVSAQTGMGYLSKDLPHTVTLESGKTVILNIDVDTGIR